VPAFAEMLREGRRFGTQAWLFLLSPCLSRAFSRQIMPGQASHDYSWFGSINNIFFMKQKTYEQYQCQWGFVTEIN
jgi:hypothetical protein